MRSHNEIERQADGLEMIASENYTSPAVMQAVGSVLTNKYAEGYPGRRYYGGCEYVDVVEQLAIDRAKQLFGAELANVQPHSGSQANMAVYLAALAAGRHRARPRPGPRRPPDARHEAEHLRHALQLRQLRRDARHEPPRLRSDRQARPRAQAEDDRRRRECLPARDSARQVRRDRPRSRREADGRHGPLRRPRRRRAAQQPGAVRRFRHHDHAQNAPRPARRLVPRQRRVRQDDQQPRVPRHSRRPADARHRRQGDLLRRSAAARVQSSTASRSSTTPRRWPKCCSPAA